jgi:hypothetical protein
MRALLARKLNATKSRLASSSKPPTGEENQFTSQPPPFIMQQFDWPQPAAGTEELLFALTAKVESCFSSFSVWHFGHSGVCSPKRIASNLCPQDSQRYSKIGIHSSNSDKNDFTAIRRSGRSSRSSIIDTGATSHRSKRSILVRVLSAGSCCRPRDARP